MEQSKSTWLFGLCLASVKLFPHVLGLHACLAVFRGSGTSQPSALSTRRSFQHGQLGQARSGKSEYCASVWSRAQRRTMNIYQVHVFDLDWIGEYQGEPPHAGYSAVYQTAGAFTYVACQSAQAFLSFFLEAVTSGNPVHALFSGPQSSLEVKRGLLAWVCRELGIGGQETRITVWDCRPHSQLSSQQRKSIAVNTIRTIIPTGHRQSAVLPPPTLPPQFIPK